MATTKLKVLKTDTATNYDQMKEEIIQLITGHDPNSGGDFDYVKMLKRVTLLLIAVYGISRVQLLRQLAISIVTTALTKWLAQSAGQAVLRPAYARAK